MSEFEAWWNKERDIKELEATYKITTPEELIDSLAELAWKAALEWVILIHDESYDNPEKGIYVGDIIRDKLEKELK